MNTVAANPNQTTDQEIHLYQAIALIGYASINIGPDLAMANNKLADFLNNPKSQHIEAAKRIVR